MLEFSLAPPDPSPAPPSADARRLTRLVDALVRAPTPEHRAHLAAQLRTAVDTIRDPAEHVPRLSFHADHTHERGPAVAALVRRLQAMLVAPAQTSRLAAIAAFSALVSTESESLPTRTQRTANAIRVLFATPVTDVPTARAAAALVAAFTRVNNPMADRIVDSVLLNAINLIAAGATGGLQQVQAQAQQGGHQQHQQQHQQQVGAQGPQPAPAPMPSSSTTLSLSSTSSSSSSSATSSSSSSVMLPARGAASPHQPHRPQHPHLSMDRARSAMLIAELAAQPKVPHPILSFQHKLRADLWHVIWDPNPAMRHHGVRALLAVLHVTVHRAEHDVAKQAMSAAMATIRHALSPPPAFISASAPVPASASTSASTSASASASASTSASASASASTSVRRCRSRPRRRPSSSTTKSLRDVAVIHGSLRMLGALLKSNDTSVFMLVFSSELCSLALPYQTCSETEVRQAVADLLPSLVRLDRSHFAQRFFDSVHLSTLQLIRDRKFPAEERGRSLVSLAEIAEQMPEHDNSRLLRDALTVCQEALGKPRPGEDIVRVHPSNRIPEEAVITTISHLAKASRGSPVLEKALKEGLLTQMFNTNFTNALVTAVDEVGRAVPFFDVPIRMRLTHLIAATLKKRLPSRKDGLVVTDGVVPGGRGSRGGGGGGGGEGGGGEKCGPRVQQQMRSQHGSMPAPSVARTRSYMSLSGQPTGGLVRRDVRGSGIPGKELRISDIAGDQRSAMRRQVSARKFFKQVPIAEELHRIDSSSVLSSKSSSAQTLEDLVKQGSGTASASPSSSYRGGTTLSLLGTSEEDITDKDNSPCVALKAIVNYEFADLQVADLCAFTNEFVIGYVEYNSVKVRALAVAASAKLMISAATLWAEPAAGRGRSKRLNRGVHGILSQMLSLAVADPSTDVRFIAIRSLDHPAFYPYLLQPDMLNKLFVCFYDESLALRESSLSLAGRLNKDNPANILPALRRYLMHLMTVLKCDGDFFARDRREATELVYTLVLNAANLVLPYIGAVMGALLIRLKEAQNASDTGSALPVLLTIAKMGGMMSKIDLSPFRAELVPLLVGSVLDAQAAEPEYRKASLRALTAFVQNTGFVIEPHIVHTALLPELLQLLKSESEAKVRLLAEALLGSLGAVDPVDNKYAAILDYSSRSAASSEKLIGNGSHIRSAFRLDNPSSHVSNWGTSAPRATRHQRGDGPHLSKPNGGGGLTQENAVGTNTGRRRPRSAQFAEKSESERPSPYDSSGPLSDNDEFEPSLSLFGAGGAELADKVRSYCPVWGPKPYPTESLMRLLDHPFTASPDYFPSAALDILHKIIGNPRLRVQHREACQAIGNIIKALGPKCTNFLSAVVPRMLWLLAHSSSTTSGSAATFTQLQQHVMQRIGDIVSTAEHNYLPYAFDTVLLAWNYMHIAKDSAACITSVCGLLSRLRRAIGDAFKPVIATVVPPLLCALAHDTKNDGLISRAVLNTLESFGPLLGEYRDVVMISVTRVVTSSRNATVREEAMATLIRLLKNTHSFRIVSSVVHTFLQVLAGAYERTFGQDDIDEQDLDTGTPLSKFEWLSNEKLAILAASAFVEVAKRAEDSFQIFVPVVAKALRVSEVWHTNRAVYRTLRSCLMSKNSLAARELLSEDLELLGGSAPHLPGLDGTSPNGASSDMNHIHGLVPPRRGGSFLGRPTLPLGTRVPQPRVQVAEHILRIKWDVTHNSKAEDWVNWYENLGAAMFEQSGSVAFRACNRIAESYPHFVKQLFNAAFLSCWATPLSQATRTQICDSLEIALASETIPLNVLQALLNLFEYMDHDEKPLPASTELLAATACKCGAFAKAIRYREKEYSQHIGRPEQLKTDISGDDGLIAIYEKLGHIESAVGIIIHYQDQSDEILQEDWFEKLRRWDDALAVYERSGSEDVTPGQAVVDENGVVAGGALYADKRQWGHLLGRLRCLNEIGEWQQMNALLQKTKTACNGNVDALRELALDGKGASVAFDLARWDEFEEWVGYIRLDTYDGFFYNTLLSVKRGKEDPRHLEQAEVFLNEARQKLDLELTARVSEAYPRAYTHVVNAQVLVELEEMIQVLRMPKGDLENFGNRRLQSLWSKRLKGCKQDRFTWYRLLMIRALVMQPTENKDQWLEFATMCRKTGRLPMSRQALNMLMLSYAGSGPSQSSLVKPDSGDFLSGDGREVSSLLHVPDLDIRFACIKHMWAVNRRHEAYEALQACRHEFWPDHVAASSYNGEMCMEAGNVRSDRSQILAGEVFSKLSKWGERICESNDSAEHSMEDSLEYAERATRIRPGWYKAWHYWGVLNTSRFEQIIERAKANWAECSGGDRKAWHRQKTMRELRHGQAGRKYLVEAIRGYFMAIDLEGKSGLEDTLKVLTLWFNYGDQSHLYAEFNEHFRVTNVAMWLEVVPQIIARLHSVNSGIQNGVKALLTRIGKEHPQVAVYPLTVAKTSTSAGGTMDNRSGAATEILRELKTVHPEIVEQSEVVSRELIRVAILWVESWFEKLEEASKFFFVEHNVDAMLDVMLGMHHQFEQGPETESEEAFAQEFGQELSEAANICRRYRAQCGRMKHHNEQHPWLVHAWVIYQQIFKRLQRQQQAIVSLDLPKVSPALASVSNLVLAVPGTYNPDEGGHVIGIQSFGSQLSVVQSKQRPRKLSILGNDGRQYQFLLKGHEDLRQDERVMQVFGLVNKLFAKSSQRHILNGVDMKTYSVIALSPNAGLIEWVPDCDTMHALVKEYREVRKIMPNIEHKVMLRIAPEPDRLPLLHKVNLFEFMLQNTVSLDIAKVLWLKSRNSEMWLERRNTYARSLATTSMTGYLLGLGDRHPSNLMIDRSSGKILHIDFGDCFEVAMKREKYPEKVPFRLTRMLVQALEPCGVDGYFRHTAEATMDVLRQKAARESLMAMMEAFIYDPLIRWKLLAAEELVQIKEERDAIKAEQAPPPSPPPPPPTSAAAIAPLHVPPPDHEALTVIQSLRETGSLSASLHMLAHRERVREAAAAAVEPSPAGAMATPHLPQPAPILEEDNDPANLQTPNEQARRAQMRVIGDGDPTEVRIANVSNGRAQVALNRFEDKLRGTDFGEDEVLTVEEQVDHLIRDAQNVENLCALFMGWCAFW